MARICIGIFVVRLLCPAAGASPPRGRAPNHSSHGSGQAEVAAWLAAHPRVAQAIYWRSPNRMQAAYPDWSAADKNALYNAVAAAMAAKPTGLNPVPPNPIKLPDKYEENMFGAAIDQGLLPNDARKLFFTYIGNSLALEITHSLPWSITEYNDSELKVLFSCLEMFPVLEPGRYYETLMDQDGWCVPAPPDLALKFLREQQLIGQTRAETIGRMLDWCTHHLVHFVGGDPVDFENTWHYRGSPPAIRIMEGTTMTPGGRYGMIPGKRHFTAGCWGTTGFLRATLRAANIPVVNVVMPPRTEEQHPHSLPYFPTERKYLTHADDLYGWFKSNYPPHPAAELLIDQGEFDKLFGAGVSVEDKRRHISHRDNELAMKYLPLRMLSEYGKDQAAGKSHAAGSIFACFKRFGSVDQLEASGLWTRMDNKIRVLGGIDKVNELLNEIESNELVDRPVAQATPVATKAVVTAVPPRTDYRVKSGNALPPGPAKPLWENPGFNLQLGASPSAAKP